MTVHVLGEVAIGDVGQFLEMFGTEGQEKRAEHGCSGAWVFTPAGESGKVVVLLEFPSDAALTAFRNDGEAPAIMRKGGAQGPPKFTVLNQVGDFDH